MAEDQPAWLKSGGNAQAASPVAAGGAAPAKDVPYKSTVKFIMMIANLGFMVFMAATGALGIAGSNNVDDTGVVFVGIYLILFAGIVTVFELSQLCPGGKLDLIVKKNFGFLYGYIGKGAFLLFVGILCFGLDSPRQLAIACGVLVAAWGCTTILLAMKFPDYFDKKEKYIP